MAADYTTAMTRTTKLRRFKGADKAAHTKVAEYVGRYFQNRPFFSEPYPLVSTAWEPIFGEWPVRNLMESNGKAIAHFSTYEAAELSLLLCRQEYNRREHARREREIAQGARP